MLTLANKLVLNGHTVTLELKNPKVTIKLGEQNTLKQNEKFLGGGSDHNQRKY